MASCWKGERCFFTFMLSVSESQLSVSYSPQPNQMSSLPSYELWHSKPLVPVSLFLAERSLKMKNYAYLHSTRTPQSGHIGAFCSRLFLGACWKYYTSQRKLRCTDMSLTNLGTTRCLQCADSTKWTNDVTAQEWNAITSSNPQCLSAFIDTPQTVGVFGFRTNVALISKSFHAAFLLVAVTLWDSRFLILSGLYLGLQDLDSGHPWTRLAVRHRTTVLEPKISPGFSRNGYLLSGQISQCVASRSGVNKGCVPFRSKRACVGSLERLKSLNVT